MVAPRPALAHRSGHAWEQAVLPLTARGASLILSPANTAPLASGRNVVYVHDLAPLREPAWFGHAYGAWHRSRCAGSLRGRCCCLCRRTSWRASSESCSGSIRIACAWCPRRRGRPVARSRASPHGARRAIRAGPRNAERAQEPRAARPGGAQAPRSRPGGRRRRSRPLLPAGVGCGRPAARLRG